MYELESSRSLLKLISPLILTLPATGLLVTVPRRLRRVEFFEFCMIEDVVVTGLPEDVRSSPVVNVFD